MSVGGRLAIEDDRNEGADVLDSDSLGMEVDDGGSLVLEEGGALRDITGGTATSDRGSIIIIIFTCRWFGLCVHGGGRRQRRVLAGLRRPRAQHQPHKQEPRRGLPWPHALSPLQHDHRQRAWRRQRRRASCCQRQTCRRPPRWQQRRHRSQGGGTPDMMMAGGARTGRRRSCAGKISTLGAEAI